MGFVSAGDCVMEERMRYRVMLLIAGALRLCPCPVHAAPMLEPGAAIPTFEGKDRAYAVTAKGEFARENVQAEVTVTIRSGHGGNGCAFLGLGSGKPDPPA